MRIQSLILSASFGVLLSSPIFAQGTEVQSKRLEGRSGGGEFLSQNIGRVGIDANPFMKQSSLMRPGRHINRGAPAGVDVDFYPNGDANESDMQTDILYTPDGQYVLIAGLSPNGGSATLAVHDGATLGLIRIITLSHDPAEMAYIPGTDTVMMANPSDDQVAIVDFVTGTELTVIPVGDQPGAIAVSPDGSRAVVQSSELSATPTISVIDLATNTEISRFGAVGSEVNYVFSIHNKFEAYIPPIFLPDGIRIAIVDDPNEQVQIVNIDTQAVTVISFPTDFRLRGGIAATPDGSLLAISSTDFRDAVVTTIDGNTLATQSYIVGSANVAFIDRPLISGDGAKIAGLHDTGYGIVDLATGIVIQADTSGFNYHDGFVPVADLGGGEYFFSWFDAAGNLGYQIFDWDTGDHIAEYIDNDLHNSTVSVSKHQVIASPTHDTQIVFVDSFGVYEQLVMLDLNPANTQALVNIQCGDVLEGDFVFDVELSQDKGTAVVMNRLSSNAYFVDTATMEKSGWVDVIQYATDVAITPDGGTVVIVGAKEFNHASIDSDDIQIVDRASGVSTLIPLPTNARARSVFIDATGQYAYTLLSYGNTENSELVRIDLGTKAIDSVVLPINGVVSHSPFETGFSSPLIGFPAVIDGPHRWAAQSNDGQYLAVLSGNLSFPSNNLTLVDISTWAVVQEIPLPVQPLSATFSSDDGSLYVLLLPSSPAPFADPVGNLVKIDVDFDGISAITDMATYTTGFLSIEMTLSPDDTKLYVGDWAVNDPGNASYIPDSLRVFDAASMTELPPIGIPILNTLFGAGFTFNPPTHFSWSPDGSTLTAFTLDDGIYRIDHATGIVTESYSTGFYTPLDVFPMGNTPSGERFLVGSGSNKNDGLAWITLPSSSCSADLTGDGELDFFDVSAFLMAFGQQDPAADFTGDGEFDFFDVSAFLQAFNAGCP